MRIGLRRLREPRGRIIPAGQNEVHRERVEHRAALEDERERVDLEVVVHPNEPEARERERNAAAEAQRVPKDDQSTVFVEGISGLTAIERAIVTS
ncbi:hypothetical protein U1Q18_000092 [Sarracenia purpurea var. burkii]